MPLILKLFKHFEGETTFIAEHVFEGEYVTLGRSQGCTLTLDDPEKRLSRIQAEFVKTDQGYVLKVLSRTSRMLINREELEPESQVTIRNGDSVLMDIYELEIVSVADEELDPEATMAFSGRLRPASALAVPAQQTASVAAAEKTSGSVDEAPAASIDKSYAAAAEITAAPGAPVRPEMPAKAPGRRIGGLFAGYGKPLVIGTALIAGVMALFPLWPALTGLWPDRKPEKNAEQEIARLNGEVTSLFKLVENVRSELKEAVSVANRDVENIGGKIRVARAGQERATLDAALSEAKQAAQMNASLERKLRDRAEGPEGIPKAQGNLGAVSVALKSGDKAGAVGLLGETVATLSLIHLSAGEDRKTAQVEQQRRREELRIAEAAAKADDEVRAKVQAEARARETEARAKSQNIANAKAESEARGRAEGEARARADSEARSRMELEARARADADSKAQSEARARAEARAEATAKARAEAEVRARADAEARAKSEDERRTREQIFQFLGRVIR